MTQTIVIEFYTRPECSLCEDATELLEIAGHHWPLDVRTVNILKDRQLYERYGNRIPVIEFDDGATLEPPITRDRLTALIRRHVQK